MKITKITAAALSAAIALSLCACGKTGTGGGDEIALRVGDATLTKTELENYSKSYTDYGLGFDMAKESATNMLSLEAVFAAAGMSYTDEEKAQQKADKDAMIENFGGQDAYEEYIKNMGMTDELVDRTLNTTYAGQKIFADEASDEKVKQNFEENYLHAKHILLATMDTSTQEKYDDAKIAEQKKLADELLARAQGGEDFDALVEEYSEDPGSKSQPDGYYFTAGEMVQEFEDTTRSLEINGIGMCESDYGYHIIKRLPLEDNEEAYMNIRQQLLQAAEQEKLPALMEQYGLKVEENESVIKELSKKKED